MTRTKVNETVAFSRRHGLGLSLPLAKATCELPDSESRPDKISQVTFSEVTDSRMAERGPLP